MVSTRKIAAIIVLAALGVAASPINIPMGPTKAFPFQHALNVVTGILLGPWSAVLTAVIVGTIRIGLGTGTIFAYPGGIPGGLVVGLVYWYLKKTDIAAFTEPIGTSLGAIVSATLIVQFFPRAMLPIFGVENQVLLFIIYWAFSCVPGSVIGFALVKGLRRAGIEKRLLV